MESVQPLCTDTLAEQSEMLQSADPVVSRNKFDQQLAEFRRASDAHRSRGVLLLEAQFPTILMAFAVPRIKPLAIAFAVLIDFTNYDLVAPSVHFVNPLTKERLRIDELDTVLPRQVPQSQPQQFIPGPGGQLLRFPIPIQSLVQAHPPENIPFICFAGIREYHEHPAHSGDSWLLHRGRGEGTLGFIVDQLCAYGTDPIDSYNPQFNIAFDAAGNLQFTLLKVSFRHSHYPS